MDKSALASNVQLMNLCFFLHLIAPNCPEELLLILHNNTRPETKTKNKKTETTNKKTKQQHTNLNHSGSEGSQIEQGSTKRKTNRKKQTTITLKKLELLPVSHNICSIYFFSFFVSIANPTGSAGSEKEQEENQTEKQKNKDT